MTSLPPTTEIEKAPSSQIERCDEVQAIVERMPTKFATYIALIVTLIVSITLVLSFIISFPDTVDGRISLTASAAPVRLVANSSGRLQLFHNEGDSVQQEELLACIQNAAEPEQILELECILKSPFDISENEKLMPLKEGMGEISNNFMQYMLAVNLYKQHLNSVLYYTEIQNLLNQITSDQEILRHIEVEKQITKEILDLNSKELKKDSLLIIHKAITEKDLDKQRTSYLNASENYWNIETNCATVQARINKNKIEIKRIQIEEKETGEKLLADIEGKRSNLFNQISVWKERYLLASPIVGKIEYLGFWRNNSFVQAGEELITVIPKQQELFGEVRITSVGMGKIKVGQPVNVKVDNYPYDEYGFIKGEVSKISQIPCLLTTQEGQVDSYLIIVNFPNGAKTNFGVILNIDFESKGTAEIITKNKKLIERLFDNLKSLGTK